MTRLTSKYSNQAAKKNDGMSNNKKREGIAREVDQLVENVEKLVESHNALAKIVQNKLSELEERLDSSSIIQKAIAQIVGETKVGDNARAIRIDILEKDAAEQGASVAKALAEGRLVKSDKATETSLVVTTIKKADGTPMYPTKNYLPMSYYKQEIQPLLKDKEVGVVVALPEDGGTIEILEIYEEVKQTPTTP